ncbi:LacI family DNA-binding transcriptional regulator [Asticcacaulis solisilvae]|uniref:LacI family DNA-binding transcriptional regulator n=1 Tax=Asticcacaulis solisilvae TaxID=1217274 RepID=UPI003FD73078
MSTIYDVAELAGVSAKTVSRVLNDDPAVKAPTRERVRNAMTKLEYRPNSQARSLRKGENKSVGMLLEDPASGYQGRFHHAMLMASMETQNHLAIDLFAPGRTDFPREDIARFVADAQFKAMVLLPPLCDYGPLKTFLKDHHVHCVLISPTTPDDHYPSVNMDDRKAARDVTDYLLSLGHRKIAHIAGHPEHAAAFLRRQGFNEAFDAAGIPRPPKDYTVEGLFNFKSGIEAAEKLLSLKDRPTAIFASNDEMAAATCSVAHKKGLRIPEDLSVVGFDDAPIASAVWPALTTVRQPYLDMAKRTLQILNAAGDTLHRSDVQERHIIPHELVVRESTGPAPAA